MTAVLLVVGLLATTAGFVMVGFGIPNNAFGLGNTLILAGSTSVAAGLVLIGLAAVHSQLRKINAALHGRAGRSTESVESLAPPTARMTPVAQPWPVPPRAPAVSKPEFRSEADLPPLPEMSLTEAPRAAEPPRMPEPPRMTESPRMPDPPRMPEPQRNVEPRFPVSPASAPPGQAAGPLDWLRSKSKLAAPMPTPPMPMPPMPVRPAAIEPLRSVAMEPPVVEVPDEAPLSPRPPQRPSMTPPVSEQAFEPNNEPRAEPRTEPRSFEPKPWSPGRPEAPAETALRAEQPRAAPQPEPPKDGFDLVWPDRSSPAGSPVSEAAKREPALDMPLPPIPARPRESKPVDRRPPGPAKMAGERGPAILKSGVIDGMPYTLYADGSIEAELPQGTVKFSSVDALRSHLEKQA